MPFLGDSYLCRQPENTAVNPRRTPLIDVASARLWYETAAYATLNPFLPSSHFKIFLVGYGVRYTDVFSSVTAKLLGLEGIIRRIAMSEGCVITSDEST